MIIYRSIVFSLLVNLIAIIYSKTNSTKSPSTKYTYYIPTYHYLPTYLPIYDPTYQVLYTYSKRIVKHNIKTDGGRHTESVSCSVEDILVTASPTLPKSLMTPAALSADVLEALGSSVSSVRKSRRSGSIRRAG